MTGGLFIRNFCEIVSGGPKKEVASGGPLNKKLYFCGA